MLGVWESPGRIGLVLYSLHCDDANTRAGRPRHTGELPVTLFLQ